MNPTALGVALFGGALAGLALPHAYIWLVTKLQTSENLPPAWAGGGGTSAPHCVSLRSAMMLVAASELCGIGLAVASAGVAWQLRHAPGGLPLLTVWLMVTHTGVLLAAVDIAVRRLPTPAISAAALAVGVVLAGQAATTGQAHTLVTAMLAAAALGGLYLAFVLLAGSAMGLGDVRLAALLGAALGTIGWPAVLLGGLLPFVLAVPEAMARLALNRAHIIAFGPYLIAGALMAVAIVR